MFFPAKSAVIAALLVMLLLMGASALRPVGGETYGSGATFSRREGCFGNGCQRMYIFHNKGRQMVGLSLRKLQQSRLQPPPAPSKNKPHIWFVPPAPPPPAQLAP